MTHSIFKASTLLGAATLVIASPLALTTPAYAAGRQCSAYQEKTFSTPGGNPTVKLRLCLRIDSVDRGYTILQGSWKNGGGPLEADKFDDFEIRLFLERNQNTYSNDKAESKALANSINNSDKGEFESEIGPHMSSGGGGLPSGKWTTDGQVIYNINNDGVGGYVWSLTGSPSITI